ncbi:unnamed protein product [Didymodactylos carnosus]|uniref:Insulin-like domain-containing protein n=1 Tax=Didymodactylos carnosus TaxID=1234261 RepID=A0A813X7Q4_9BILA|nr:unnamed protein product [Didymodactylos carnosus]CAF0933867.1 unnamed protein product [Didymodactylos carnosus]CAF3648666.1 unnamed protein product [Didymodactylos carnosus]CAF3709895.1 unnamed protein product [Didymodactylos carnosus]
MINGLILKNIYVYLIILSSMYQQSSILGRRLTPSMNKHDIEQLFSKSIDNIKQLDQLHSKEERSHGKKYSIKSAGITYTQRIIEGECLVEYDDRLLAEGQILQHKKRLYKVEDCFLERAFHVCGPNILFMLKIVCRLVKQYTKIINGTRTTTLSPLQATLLERRDVSPKIITESCCLNICTVSELTRYCPRKT